MIPKLSDGQATLLLGHLGLSSDTAEKALSIIESAVHQQYKEWVAKQKLVAYLSEDGERCVTAKTFEGARRDGGAIWSTMRPFSVPAFTHPATDDTELLKQALEALDAELSDNWKCNSYHPKIYEAMNALRARLENRHG